MDPDDIIYLDSTDQSYPEVTPIYLSDTSPEVTICLDTPEVSPQKPNIIKHNKNNYFQSSPLVIIVIIVINHYCY